MIWLLLIIIALATTLFLVTPFLNGAGRPVVISLFMAGLIGASVGLYAVLGTPTPPAPELSAETPSALEAAQSVTQEDIEGMVMGLATRLRVEPDDPAGWTRLIRSRIVLGDVPNLLKDHKAMVEHYADQPNMIEQINKNSGFTELARRLYEEARLTPETP